MAMIVVTHMTEDYLAYPYTRVILVKLDHDVRRSVCSPRLHELYVSSLRVARISNAAVPLSDTLRKYEQVVAVHVHWVRLLRPVIDDQADAAVAAKVVNTRLLGERSFAHLGFEQGGVVVVRAER